MQYFFNLLGRRYKEIVYERYKRISGEESQ